MKKEGELNVIVEAGLIFEGGIIVVPNIERARTLVIHGCHDTTTAGHLGRDKTLATVKLRFK